MYIHLYNSYLPTDNTGYKTETVMRYILFIDIKLDILQHNNFTSTTTLFILSLTNLTLLIWSSRYHHSLYSSHTTTLIHTITWIFQPWYLNHNNKTLLQVHQNISLCLTSLHFYLQHDLIKPELSFFTPHYWVC